MMLILIEADSAFGLKLGGIIEGLTLYCWSCPDISDVKN